MNQQNVVITGASSGIGKSIALKLSSMGMNVFALARRRDKLRALQARSNGNIVGIPTDVTIPDQIKAAYQKIELEHGPIEVLINNAGVYQRHEFATQELGVIDRIIDTNLKGALYCTRLVLPYMLQRRSGRIINISSMAGVEGTLYESAYAASKHGVVGFSQALTHEVQPHGISVTTLCPGAVDTPLWHSEKNPYPVGDVHKALKPEDVAELVEFLLKQPKNVIYRSIMFFCRQELH